MWEREALREDGNEEDQYQPLNHPIKFLFYLVDTKNKIDFIFRFGVMCVLQRLKTNQMWNDMQLSSYN